MDKPAFSPGGYGMPLQQTPPPSQQQQQQTVDNAGQNSEAQHAAIQLALAAFVQQNKGISVVDIAALTDHLEMLMKDCSQANIQAGKNWVVHFCQNPQQYDLLVRALVSIAISRQTFDEKLHIVYLTNDILSHCERKQQQWIKDAIHPSLVPMLRAAYFFPGVDDSQRQRVIKVLDIWRNREFFPPVMIDSMEMHVKRPPLLPNNGQGPISTPTQEQWQPPQGQPFHPPPHLHPHPPPPHQFQHHPHQQQNFLLQPQFQQPFSHQYPGFPHHPQQQQQQMQNQHPFPQHPHAHPQQMPHHSEPWMSQAPGPNPGFPPFHGNIPVPQHPPQGVPPPPFLHQPNPYPQAPTFQNHQQPAPFQQPHFSHPPRNVPVVVPTPALAPPPPEPTHRDVLTRELHAGQMISKIEADADYYEPLPAYVSVPFKKKAHQDKVLLDSVAQLVQETDAIKAEELAKGDEGWHEGQLNGFYRNHGGKRKEAFSENPRRRRSRQRSNTSGHKREMGVRRRSFSGTPSRSRSRSLSPSRRRNSRSRSRSYSRSRSRSSSPQYRRQGRRESRDRSASRGRSRNRGRTISRSRSRSRGRSRSRSRSVSRGRGRSRSRDAGPRHRVTEDAFPMRKFGLGSNPQQHPHQPQFQQQQQQQQSPSRPAFQPARFPQ
ncbi:hypothetical protein F5H01DRAFT_331046 [Linnemannia elongata]|nr:hypothetical protein F5H01DRAFT_331046 [Linnemannia elongata]